MKMNGAVSTGTVCRLVLVAVWCYGVNAIPSQRQTQELMILDALGRKGASLADHTQGSLIDILGRSKVAEYLLGYQNWYRNDIWKA